MSAPHPLTFEFIHPYPFSTSSASSCWHVKKEGAISSDSSRRTTGRICEMLKVGILLLHTLPSYGLVFEYPNRGTRC